MGKLNEVSSDGKSLEHEKDQWQSKQVIRSLTMHSQIGLKTKAHRIVILKMSKFVRLGSKKCGEKKCDRYMDEAFFACFVHNSINDRCQYEQKRGDCLAVQTDDTRCTQRQEVARANVQRTISAAVIAFINQRCLLCWRSSEFCKRIPSPEKKETFTCQKQRNTTQD